MAKPAQQTQSAYKSIVAPVSQSGTVEMSEHQDSGEIFEDLQGGTITHIFTIQGNPKEAQASLGLANFQIGSPHPWYNAGGPDQSATTFLIKRNFEHYVRDSDSTKRFTKATFVYRTRPCVAGYEQIRSDGLQSKLTWWSNDNPPRRLGQGFSGITVMQPVMVLKRHWPAVRLSSLTLQAIDNAEGTRNAGTFEGWGRGVWLLYQVQYKRLWGGVNQDNRYDLSLIWLGDKIRKHNHWWALQYRKGGLRVPLVLNDLELVHDVSELYPISSVDFDQIVPIDWDECRAPI